MLREKPARSFSMTCLSFPFTAINDLLLLFVFLYTMFFFIRHGRQLLERELSYLPLSVVDSDQLLSSLNQPELLVCVAAGIGSVLWFEGVKCIGMFSLD